MKNLIVSFFALFLASTVSAQELVPAPGEPTPIEPPTSQTLLWGTWTADHPIHNNNVRIYIGFDFAPESMALQATCTFQGHNVQLTTTASSNVIYEENMVHVLENNQSSVTDGYHYCNAGLAPSTLHYYFKDASFDRAVLVAPVPYNHHFQITRVKED